MIADHSQTRRQFVTTLMCAGTGLALAQEKPAPAARKGIRLGLDNFAVRAFGWKAPQLIDYAASLKLDTLFISDIDAFEDLGDAPLQDLRKQAADKGLQLYAGTWSICPTSQSFRANRGTAEEHLALGIRVARAIGSPVIRVILGTVRDRQGEGGIEPHIAATVKVCKACRSRALDAGVKIAIENHAGDLHSRELARLIEEAGRDYVGANLDSGNATWTLEDPLDNLENLGPYVLCTSLRDSAVWEYEDGARAQWVAMGDGTVDWQVFFRRFAELCPTVPVNIETISGGTRELPYLKPEFWKAYPNLKAADFSRFVALAKRGKPRDPLKPAPGKDRKLADQEFQKAQLERSLTYCKEALGLGLRS